MMSQFDHLTPYYGSPPTPYYGTLRGQLFSNEYNYKA